MPKDIKGNAGKKPPEAAPNHDDIDDWIKQQMPGLQSIVTKLDALIRATVPDLQFAVKRKRAYYGLATLGWIIELAAYDVSVNVLFLGGADFDSPRSGDRRPNALRQSDQRGGGAGTGDARMDRAGGTYGRLDVI